jgi:TetR/AcrR family transcriptional regulator, cholesterol catabolism regulator
MARIVHGKDKSKRDIITERAAVLFREKGYNATSMRDLAEAIGIEAPSLYNHIGSKSELLQDLCFKVADLFLTNMNEVEKSPASAGWKMEHLIRFHIKVMLTHYEMVYIAEHEWKQLSEPYLTDYKNRRREYRNRFAAIISGGIKKKEFKPVDPGVAVLTILSAINGIEHWHQSRKQIAPEALENDIITMLLQGLVA